MDAFWKAATALDPNALDLTEDRRFPFCTLDGLTDLAKRAGLASVDCTRIEMPTVFKDFQDYWDPFTLGAGPAPGYCMSSQSASAATVEGKTARQSAAPQGWIDPPKDQSMGGQGVVG